MFYSVVGVVVLNVYISSGTIGSEGVKCHNPGCGGSSLTNARWFNFLHFHFTALLIHFYRHHLRVSPCGPPHHPRNDGKCPFFKCTRDRFYN